MMLCRSVVVCALMVLALSPGAAYAGDEETIQQISRLEAELRDAMIARDENALEKLLADDLVHTHATGKLDDKERRIAGVAARPFDYESLDRSEVVTRVYGAAAVVTGLSTFRLKGQDVELKVRTIGVWARRDGRWQLVGSQGTFAGPVPKQP